MQLISWNGNGVRFLFIIVGALLLVWFLLPFFSNRILNIGNVTGIIVSLVLLFYGIFFHKVNFQIAWFWMSWIGKVVEIFLGLCILAILVLAVMTMICMGQGMNTRNTGTEAVENRTVIVLGCKVKGDKPSLMLEERLQTALEYLKAHPDANAFVSGGQGKDEIVAEADVMYRWLTEHGILESRLLKEDRSTDTHENLRYCKEMIERLDPNQWKTDVIIVTNEFHEYRALKIAQATGFNARPLPAATAWWLFPTYYVREMYGILEDWFLVS